MTLYSVLSLALPFDFSVIMKSFVGLGHQDLFFINIKLT
jgi:hypothetical protein